ncbi:hypothetical protein F5884DRAFT_55164 [Xylogone sp. PMI_703]|nr:hypothetical protein F5884DRAFT_55164 [Xylogone sp. PMI_703]
MGGWDNHSERDLLLAVIDEGSLKSIDWESVSRRMAAQGHSYSKEGCRQHFLKLKRESGKRGGSSTSTPRKPRTPKSTKTSSKGTYDKNMSFDNADNDDDEEDLMGQSPSKGQKVKREPKQEDDDEWSTYGQENVLFKMEDSNANGKGHIDLVNEDLYEA